MFQGRQRLDWDFAPELVVPSGETWTGTFTVEGPFAGGHWNEAWLTLDEFGDTRYTWPAAGIEVIEATKSTTTTISGAMVVSEIWQIGSETWQIGNPKTLVIWGWGSS